MDEVLRRIREGEAFGGTGRCTATNEAPVMVTLILVVCLSSAPTLCREERPPIDAVSPLACIVEGQQIAIGWLEEHPKWRLSGWRCQFGRHERA